LRGRKGEQLDSLDCSTINTFQVTCFLLHSSSWQCSVLEVYSLLPKCKAYKLIQELNLTMFSQIYKQNINQYNIE
jgi:hypothetical protein